MPTVMSHAVVGIALGSLTRFPTRRPLFWALSALLPVVPDLDVAGMLVGIPFHSLWGHRGISHSFAGALAIGVMAAAVTSRRLGARFVPLALYCAAITASHGVLDACTDGGPGVALFAPFDETRYFVPWRPIPVSPLVRNFFSAWGWQVFRAELVMLWLPSAMVILAATLSRRRG